MGIPADYHECIDIREHDGAEHVEFCMDSVVRQLVADDAKVDELQSRLTEIAFIGIVFSRISDHFSERRSRAV